MSSPARADCFPAASRDWPARRLIGLQDDSWNVPFLIRVFLRGTYERDERDALMAELLGPPQVENPPTTARGEARRGEAGRMASSPKDPDATRASHSGHLKSTQHIPSTHARSSRTSETDHRLRPGISYSLHPNCKQAVLLLRIRTSQKQNSETTWNLTTEQRPNVCVRVCSKYVCAYGWWWMVGGGWWMVV